MTYPNFRALCAELAEMLSSVLDSPDPTCIDLISRARAVLAAEPQQLITVPKLLALTEDLEGALLSAVDSLQDWGGYVDPYFKNKHSFDADVANLKSHAQRARNVIDGKDFMEEVNG